MRIKTCKAEETFQIGRTIGKESLPGDIFWLIGDLGSGKTLLTKGIADGLGIDPNEVTSPSFILVAEHHKGKFPLYHIDIYRLPDGCDLNDIGLSNCLAGDGVVAIEWADRLSGELPEIGLRICMESVGETEREIEIEAFSARWRERLPRLWPGNL